MSEINTADMFIVYKDKNGQFSYQHYIDQLNDGNLIDEDTGDDLEAIGWTLNPPADKI